MYKIGNSALEGNSRGTFIFNAFVKYMFGSNLKTRDE